MRLYCDLHIHTALSPCSDSDMTPGNIVAMASLKGLDVIAITDHQRCGNVLPAMHHGKDFGITVIPGMELETEEEVHLVCLFPTLDIAIEFEDFVKARMPKIKNREEIFGEEWLYDEFDEKISREEDLLLVSSQISCVEAFSIIENLGGICYPAHVDRDSYSILSNLGTLPPEYHGRNLELSAKCNPGDFLTTHPDFTGYRMIHSSDAHTLAGILEPGMMVEIAQSKETETTISLIIKALRQ